MGSLLDIVCDLVLANETLRSHWVRILGKHFQRKNGQ